METVSNERFQQILISILKPLIDLGYQPKVDDEYPKIFILKKSLVHGITVSIQFQYKHHFSGSQQLFNIRVLRTNLEDTNLSSYLPLSSTLRDILVLRFGFEIFPEGQFYWQFSNESELRTRVREALNYCLQYVIEWLESPNSKQTDLST